MISTENLLKEFETGDVRMTYSIKFAAANNAYFITKFRDASAGAGILGYGGNDWIVIRYADVILSLSEVFMWLGDNASVITYLDMVCARVKTPN